MTIRELCSSLQCQVGLAFLNLKDCKSLVCLLDSTHELHSLRILDISSCSKLCRFPEGLKEIKSLEELYARETAMEELPSFVFCLDNLKVLSFAGCKGPMSSKWICLFRSIGCFGVHPSPLDSSCRQLSQVHTLSHINVSYYNLSNESITHYFCQLLSFNSLDPTINNFVSILAAFINFQS